ncbi:hypothetical protein ACWD4J_42840 [Streptomyces sp. NPDC002577]
MAAPLTHPAEDTDPTEKVEDGSAPGSDVAARRAYEIRRRRWGRIHSCERWGSLLEYVLHQARTPGQMPSEVLQTVVGALAACADEDAVATAMGVHLPALHRYAPALHRIR